MCLACAAAQAPICAVSGPCAGGISQFITMGLLIVGIAMGTARLWLYTVTAKIAPFLNQSIIKNNKPKHEKK